MFDGLMAGQCNKTMPSCFRSIDNLMNCLFPTTVIGAHKMVVRDERDRVVTSAISMRCTVYGLVDKEPRAEHNRANSCQSMTALVQINCKEFNASLEFFTSAPLSLQVESIFPADQPQEAILRGQGLRILLLRNGMNDESTLCIEEDPEKKYPLDVVRGPNGTTVRFLKVDSAGISRPSLEEGVVVTHLPRDSESDESSSKVWSVGRAGMRYRDLIPGRLGGRYIASHIHIPIGGPVPDYCHYHHVHFQMIYCYRGWVRVIYEDQGDSFVLHPGDCVLQPPMIRHRVLESSDDLEVVEIGSPAVHKTVRDFDMNLPTDKIVRDRIFSDQKFVRHIRDCWDKEGRSNNSKKWGYSLVFESEQVLEVRDSGIFKATNGVASVEFVKSGVKWDIIEELLDTNPLPSFSHEGDMMVLFVLEGSTQIEVQWKCEKFFHTLCRGSSITIPSKSSSKIFKWTNDLEILEVIVYK